MVLPDITDNLQSIKYESSLVCITYFIQSSIDVHSLEQEKEKLEASILRRSKLLENSNYVQKAPQNIVDLDRAKLQEEKEKLANIKEQLKKA